MAEGVRIGVDVGGTFTDVVAWDPAGRMESCKVPTTPANPAEGVLNGIAALAPRTGPWATLAHGTTMVTNAIVERRGAPVGFITTRGFRDVLEIGRMSRLHLYRLDLPASAEALVPRRLRRAVRERVAPDGTVLTRLHLEELPAIVEDFKREGIESVAVCLVHAYAASGHEQALRFALEANFPYVSVSSEINAEFREYERGCTTALNASVMPLAARYLDDLARRTGGKPLHLLHSAGGMMSVDAAKARPLSMAMSGPAGGVAAAAHTARALGIARALAFDMGGTTTDVCLIADGVPETAGQRKLGDYPARLPMVAVESIGAGGGSMARVEGTGALKVGPRSAGAVPGPACYGQGGEDPTVSDANILLGYLNPRRVYGGSIHLDPARAGAVIAPLTQRFGWSLIEAAHGVVEVANANMLRALRLVSVQRGYDLREFSLIAYGGAGAAGGDRERGGARALRRLFRPGLPRVAAALRHGADASRSHRRLGRQGRRRALPHAGRPVLATPPRRGARSRAGDRAAEHRLPLRGAELRARDRLGPQRPRSPEGGLRGAAPPALRLCHRRERGVRQPPRHRARLPVGHVVAGPAMIEDEWSTTIVYPGQRCVADRLGNLVIEVGGRP